MVRKRCHDRGITIDKQSMPAVSVRIIGDLCKELKNDSAFTFDRVLQTSKRSTISIAENFSLLARFTILAIYCASYNSSATDQRFFFMVGIKNATDIYTCQYNFCFLENVYVDHAFII